MVAINLEEFEMDLRYKTWGVEDQLYSPKRKVDNKISWKHPHIIGSFYSNKMERAVEYQSLNECYFYFLLELDILTKRYYVQPVKVPVPYYDSNGVVRCWEHVPDVLVFRQGQLPCLYQIKEAPDPLDKRIETVNKACFKYAESHKWNYKVVYPKQLPDEVIRNIKMLIGFVKRSKYYEQHIPLIMSRMKSSEQLKIVELLKNISSESNTLYLIPIIYHLIAIGLFSCDLTKQININSEISVNLFEESHFKTYFMEA